MKRLLSVLDRGVDKVTTEALRVTEQARKVAGIGVGEVSIRVHGSHTSMGDDLHGVDYGRVQRSRRALRSAGLATGVLAVALAAGCAAGQEDSATDSIGAEDEFGVTLTLDAAQWQGAIAQQSPQAGHRFVVVSMTVEKTDADLAPITFALPQFSVRTESALVVKASGFSAALASPCRADVELHAPGTYSCDVAFEVDEDDPPVELGYQLSNPATDEVWVEVDLPDCTWCGEDCVDLSNSSDHCGSCNNAIENDQECVNGQVACDDGALTLCDGECVNTGTSSLHCGACNTTVGSSMQCVDGDAVCDGGLSACGEECVDLNEDETHCGECNRACPDEMRCDGDGTRCMIRISSLDVPRSCDTVCSEAGLTCLEPGHAEYHCFSALCGDDCEYSPLSTCSTIPDSTCSGSGTFDRVYCNCQYVF